jgi:anti-sigma factor RsiW
MRAAVAAANVASAGVRAPSGSAETPRASAETPRAFADGAFADGAFAGVWWASEIAAARAGAASDRRRGADRVARRLDGSSVDLMTRAYVSLIGSSRDIASIDARTPGFLRV